MSARCAPRRVGATAWISSTITVRAVPSSLRPPADVRSTYSDSGVVTRTCGGRLSTCARSFCAVSPVRTAARTSTGAADPDDGAARSRARMPSSGCTRFLWMSFESALSGETYTTRTSSCSVPCAASRARPSSAARNAASVLPEPVGAATSASCPSRRAGHARTWGGVGSPSVSANQEATAGWN